MKHHRSAPELPIPSGSSQPVSQQLLRAWQPLFAASFQVNVDRSRGVLVRSRLHLLLLISTVIVWRVERAAGSASGPDTFVVVT